MGMSFSYGPPKDKQEMTALLHAAVERGIKQRRLARGIVLLKENLRDLRPRFGEHATGTTH